MKRIAIALLLVSLSGCQRTINRSLNRMFGSNCVTYSKPWKLGDRSIDYSANPRTWVEVGADGQRHPIPTPPGEIDPLDPYAKPQPQP